MYEIEQEKHLYSTIYFSRKAEHYWSTDIPYSGKQLNIHALLHLRHELIKYIVDEVYRLLKVEYPQVPRELMEIEVLCTNVNKACLLTPLSAKEIIYSNQLTDELLKQTGTITLEKYRDVIYNILQDIIATDIRYASLIQRGFIAGYHDIAGHRLIRNIVPDEVIDELCFTERMQRKQPLNTHFIFGTLLSPMFRTCYEKSLDRETIFDTMVSKLGLYLQAQLPLTDFDGNTYSLRCPITSLEAIYASKSHSGEATLSYHETVLYTRYRSDNVYSIDTKEKHLDKADIYSKLVRIANKQQRSVYQDSFYIRDEVIQKCFSQFI